MSSIKEIMKHCSQQPFETCLRTDCKKCDYNDQKEPAGIIIDGRWTFNEVEDGCWCHDDFATREEAIEAAKEYLCEDQEVMYVGQCEAVRLPTYVDADNILDQLDEHYGEECYEYDGYLFDRVTQENKEWLTDKLALLMLEFYDKAGVESTHYTMVKVEKIRLEGLI